MDEYVCSIFGLDETKALFNLEPLNFAGRHADLTEFALESVPHCADEARVVLKPDFGALHEHH